MDSSRQKSIRVLVVDDQILYREGLCELMGHWHEFEIIGQASNGQEAVDFCAMRKPDLILMDVQMPVMDGISATAAICSRYPQVRIVMLTVSAEDEHLFGAIQNGAIGYILKDTPARQLRNRLRGIAAGEGSRSGIVAAKVIKEVSSRTYLSAESEAQAALLTERETELLSLVANGLSNEEIGEQLFLSAGTVKKQLSSLMRKLCVDNRVQLAVWAVKAGLSR